MHRFCPPLLALFLTSTAFAQSVRLNWSDDESRFWFSQRSGNAKDFYIVDVQNRKRVSAFDREKLAATLSKQLPREIDSSSLRVSNIAFIDEPNKLFLHAAGKNWILNLDSYELTASKRIEGTASRLFLPSRRSGSSSQSTNIEVVNNLDVPIELLWIDTNGRERSYGTIAAGQKRSQHTFVGHVWLLRTNRRLGYFAAESDDRIVVDAELIKSVRRDRERPNRRRRRATPGTFSRGLKSPDGKYSAFVRDHNLWLRNNEREAQLTKDGSEEKSFERSNNRPPVLQWSPDSKFVIANQTSTGTDRTVYLVESSPNDQLQPKLKSYSYRKPGDELDKTTLRLFSLEDGEEIQISDELFQNPWSLRFEGWSEDGSRFYLRYNQRGHQVVRFLEVTTDGAVHPIIEEKSDTFIHYSDGGKSVFELLDDDEVLWASERTGWNHLYRYSLSKRELLNEVTSGDWNVKRIVRVDREAKRVWFYAVGVHKDQDPYHEHFCRVNFDGSDFKVLTEGDGTHSIQFEQNQKYFIDTYSRVDLAPVVELRDSESGDLISELSREDTKAKFGQRRLTERFVAKGRDGQTDIWGIIHWPRDFDPNKKYPVVENIYAGPHDHHVPKSFRTRYWHQYPIADAGMIVVQIDGMGTAWRSKKFHDVCYKNLRDAGFPDRIAWMKAAAQKYPQMDLSRVGIYGGSAGGQNAMAALLWHNDFYKVAVADCGCHDNRMDKIWWNEQWMGWPVDDAYKQNSNMENAHLLKGDLMLIVGELDQNVDPASTTQVVSKLIKANKDFEFVLVAGAGHGAAETPWASRKRLRFLKEKLGAE